MDDDFETFIKAQKAQLAQERKEIMNEQNAKPVRKKWDMDSRKAPEEPQSHHFMPLNDVEERRKALQMERKMEYNDLLTKMNQSGRNGFKENLPPKPPTPDVGLVSKLGGYSKTRKKLQEERKLEYNKMLAEMQLKGGRRPSNNATPSTQLASQNNDQDYEPWIDDRPAPPRKGWATPTYKEILARKRKEERNYRRMEDPFDQRANLGDADYNRMSLSEGNLIERYNEENAKLIALDQEFERKKVRFLDGQRPSSNPGDDLSSGYDAFPDQMLQKKSSQHQDLPQTYGQSLRKAGSEPENFHATLLVGKEMRASQDKRKKGTYREELQQQMEEAKARKLREKMEARQGQEGLMDRVNTGRSEIPAHGVSFPPSLKPAPGQLTDAYTMPPKSHVDELGLRRDLYDKRLNARAPAMGGFLENGLDFSVAPSTFSNIPPATLGLMPSHNPYSSPLNDAYFYYGMQNPLDPNMALGAPAVPSFIPPSQVSPYSMPAYPAQVSNPLHQTSVLPSQALPKTSLMPPAAPSAASNFDFPPSGNQNRRDGGGILGENPDERKRAAEEKKRMYQMELQKQMEDDRLKKQKQKEEQERYEKKLEADIANYSPFGQPGGGAPMRDRFGNVLVTRKPPAASQSGLNTSPQTHGTDYQRASGRDGYDSYAQGRTADPFPDLYKSPFSEYDQSNPLATQDHNGVGDSDELKFARGGNGIFGEPMTDEQKNKKQRYQDELHKQIEEKKKREQEEKERMQREEELFMKHIEEDNLKIQREQEEEKRKLREKAEKAERQQQEFKQQQEEQRREAERRKKEALEARLQEVRRQDDEKQKEKEQSRVKSPPIPAARIKSPMIPTVEAAMRYPSPERSKSRQSRVESARALDHLAKMKEKLNSERKRVESDLKKEKMEPEVFDPRVVIRRRSQSHNPGLLEMARNSPSIGTTRHQEALPPYKLNELRKTRANDSLPKEPGSVREDLEDWQRSRLMQQDDELHELRRQKSFEHNQMTEGKSPLGSSLLDAETQFIGMPESRQEDHPPVLADLGDVERQKSASNRRHRKVKISVEADAPSFNRKGSVTSLDPEELMQRNEERLKKIKSLEGDDISSGNPDDILKHFMAQRKHQRPPSSDTLMDDSWLRPGTNR